MRLFLCMQTHIYTYKVQNIQKHGKNKGIYQATRFSAVAMLFSPLLLWYYETVLFVVTCCSCSYFFYLCLKFVACIYIFTSFHLEYYYLICQLNKKKFCLYLPFCNENPQCFPQGKLKGRKVRLYSNKLDHATCCC